MIRVGEYLGLIKTRIMKSARKTMMKYLINRKFCLKIIKIKDIKAAKNNMPEAARISRSFKTGIL